MPTDPVPAHAHAFVPYVTGGRHDQDLGSLQIVRAVWCECGDTRELPPYESPEQKHQREWSEKVKACAHANRKPLGKKDVRPGTYCPDCGDIEVLGGELRKKDEKKLIEARNGNA